MTETDLLGPSTGISSAIHTTTYRRQVPLPDRKNIGYWLSTAFTVQTIHPDTSSTITRYAEPPNGPYSAATASLETNMRVLAFLKHQVAEVRHYGVGINSAMDLTTNPAVGAPCLKDLSQSSAHRVELFDRWDLHTPTNPTGAFTRGSVPFATRKRMWDVLNKTLQIEEQGDWDAVNLGWKTQWKVQQVQPAVPDTVTEFPGLAMTGASPAYANPGDGLLRKEARTFESKQESWILGRDLFEQKSTEADSTPGKAPAVVVPGALPPTTKVYDSTLPMLDRLSEIQVGTSGYRVRTVFSYKGSEGMVAAQLATASLTGQNQGLTGPVGVSYDYDGSFGLLSRITPFGSGWGYGQTSDGLSRVTEQKDPNGLVSAYSWDGAGRLLGVQPPSPEAGQTMTPDADSRGMVIQHAGQRTRLRFNAFGQLVLEQRSNDGSTWTSYRAHAYDAAGRKTGESIWLGGVGDESLGSRPNLTVSQSIPSFTAGHWECAQLDDQGNCIKGRYWEPDTYDSETAGGLVPGTGIQFDDYGREILRQDANGVATTTAYGERSKSVTVGLGSDAMTTHFVYDAAARLIKVVDSKGQVTNYAYDAADRILETRQYAGSTGSGPSALGTGAMQVRRWAYDSLGRTIVLDQPESGVTYYTSFTLLGKPARIVYGLPKGWRPASPDVEDASASTAAGVKVLSTVFDSLGRPTGITSNDGTIHQVMAYDESGHGLSLGKLTTATTGPSASRQLSYDGLNGRPSSLVRTIDGNRFELKMAWRNDGLLDSRTYPDGRIQGLQYDSAKAMPNGTSFGATGATTMAYEPVHWGLQGITYPNNASTFLAYSNDQARLKAITHTAPAGAIRSWSYTYDAANRLTTDGEDYYGYDALGRLTMAYIRDVGNVPAGQGIQQQFRFDSFGNRTGMSTLLVSNWAAGAPPPDLPATTSPSGDARDFRSFAMTTSEVDGMAASNQIPATAGGVPTGVGVDGYDAQGNLNRIYRTPGNSATRISMAYDALGRVISMADDARGVTEFYSYDDEGLRSQVDIWRSGVLQSKRYMIYNEARQLVAEYDLVQE